MEILKSTRHDHCTHCTARHWGITRPKYDSDYKGKQKAYKAIFHKTNKIRQHFCGNKFKSLEGRELLLALFKKMGLRQWQIQHLVTLQCTRLYNCHSLACAQFHFQSQTLQSNYGVETPSQLGGSLPYLEDIQLQVDMQYACSLLKGGRLLRVNAMALTI